MEATDMVTVYHAPLSVAFFASVEAIAAYKAGEYKKVAEIRGIEATDPDDILEEAFELTNSIMSPWEKNPAAGAIGTGHRSTSVGDVVVSPHGTFIVQGVGFRAIP